MVVAGGLVVLSVVACAIGASVLVVTGSTPSRDALALVAEAVPAAAYFTVLFGMATSFVSESKERETADARRLVAEAQLASLESRVNPHFLFNTLNSIASMTHTDPPGAERMTHQLASLMRSSLDAASKPLVSLRDEIDLVRDYLAIERVRFGNRLRYTIDVDDRAADTAIPRLSLQTLAENSVKYAVSPQRDGASIAIRAVANGTSTRVEVEDDGPGFNRSGVVGARSGACSAPAWRSRFQSHARLDVREPPGPDARRHRRPVARCARARERRRCFERTSSTTSGWRSTG